MKYLKSIFLLTILITTSFRPNIDLGQLMNKVWVLEKYNGDKGNSLYCRTHSFPKSRPGIQFLENGILKVRQNESWCGTEPIIYETVSGTWRQKSDSIIVINYVVWQEKKVTEEIKIKELTKDKLTISSVIKDEK